MSETRSRKSLFTERISRRYLYGRVAAIGAGAALLAACGRKPNSQSAGGQAQTGKPRTGGQLAISILTDPFDWDMSRVGKSIPNSDGMSWAYNSLLGFKSGPGIKFGDLVIRPELAQRWESPDGQSYTFHLQPGVKFANLPPVNGRALTSDDVKWTYEYWSRTGQFANSKLPAGQYKWLFEGMDRVETPDASTATVHFKQPYAPFFTNAASDYNPIVPHEIFDADGTLSKRVVGTGAWQLDVASSQAGSHWVWARNPTYWEEGKPYIDKITWVVLPDDASSNAAFVSKQTDIFDVTDPSGAQTLAKTYPSAVLNEAVDPRPDEIHMNVRKPPLNDLRLRQAIAYAIDHEEFIRVQTGGKGAWGLAASFLGTFTQDEIKQMLKYDPAAAKQLVSAAGYPNGIDIETTYPGISMGQYGVTQLQLLQSQLKKVGINLVLKTLDKHDYSARRKKGDYFLNLLGTQNAGEDYGSLVYALFLPGNTNNYGGVDDPPLTALLEAQQREIDPAKRKDLIRQAIRRVNTEMFWGQAICHRLHFEFYQPSLQNYAPNFGNIGWPVKDSWLAK